MITESQPQNLTESCPRPFTTNWRQELKNLDRDYWAIIDEASLESVRNRVGSTIAAASSSFTSEEKEATSEGRSQQVMVSDIIKLLGHKKAREYLK